jgi:hypothetical protein
MDINLVNQKMYLIIMLKIHTKLSLMLKIMLFHYVIMNLCYRGKVAIGKARYLLSIVF